jgi:hypothetical protein
MERAQAAKVADLKASGGLSSGEVSAALGHLSDVTRSTYRHYTMGHAGGVAPSKVDAAKAVKIKQPSAASQKKTAAIKTSRAPSALGVKMKK